MIAKSRTAAAQSDRLPGAKGQFPLVRDLGSFLRIAFAATEAAPLPAAILALLDRLGEDEPLRPQSANSALSDADFKAALGAAIPHLRAYGRSLSGSADVADDLVQDTMVRAWMARKRFVAGTNMRAWTHVILRNVYFTMVRRARFKGDWDEFSADLLLAVPASQESHIALSDMQRALMELPALQREALILMGAGGMTCEEVATITQCAVGTVKSRVARARTALKALLDGGQLAVTRAKTPMSEVGSVEQIMQLANALAEPGAVRQPLLR